MLKIQDLRIWSKTIDLSNRLKIIDDETVNTLLKSIDPNSENELHTTSKHSKVTRTHLNTHYPILNT